MVAQDEEIDKVDYQLSENAFEERNLSELAAANRYLDLFASIR